MLQLSVVCPKGGSQSRRCVCPRKGPRCWCIGSWNPSPAAEKQTATGPEKKQKSPSTLKRSAERGRRHKERQQRPLGQQLGSPLNSAAEPFVPARTDTALEGSDTGGGQTGALSQTVSAGVPSLPKSLQAPSKYCNTLSSQIHLRLMVIFR